MSSPAQYQGGSISQDEKQPVSNSLKAPYWEKKYLTYCTYFV